jgi:hypothetical protein
MNLIIYSFPVNMAQLLGKLALPVSPLSFGLAGIGLPANVTDPFLIDDANAVSITAQPPAFPIN